MSKYTFLFFATFLISISFGCKSDSSNSSYDSNEIANEIKSSDPDIVDARSRAEEKLIGKDQQGLFPDLIDGYWNYDVVVKGTGPVDDFKGQWIQLNSDYTFELGKNGVSIGGGKWNYNSEDNRLVLLDNNGSEMPTEWKLMKNGATIICVGTPDFQNNDTQIKWTNTKEKPASN